MRYWGYFGGKLALSGATSYGLLWALNAFWPPESPFFDFSPPRFGYNLPYTLMAGLWFLISCGLVYLCAVDQRYRCRVCLRRLRMPVGTGSWGRMLLLGRPRIEYICTWGHGKLNVPELHLSGMDNPEWTPQGEMWEELCAAAAADRDFER